METSRCFSLLLVICAISTVQPQTKSDDEAAGKSVDTLLREMSVTLAELKEDMMRLQGENEAQAAKLRELETTVDKLKQQEEAQAAELITMNARTNATENQVELLRKDREVKQVAFSASLFASGSGTVGPFNMHTTLIFRHVVTNIGNAYNPNTGIFTAPVRGAYHFEFYVGAFINVAHATGAVLVKNEEHIFAAAQRQEAHYGSASNGATLLLEVGDVVVVRLWESFKVFDNQNHHNTFSGHLLFTM